MKDKKIIIGLVGETGSGKDTVAKYLVEKHGANTVRFADPLSDALKIFVDDILKQDQQWISFALRKRFGNNILALALKKKIEKIDGLIIVNGIRTWDDYQMVKGFANSYVVYVTADQNLRWQRVFGRGEKTDDKVDFAKFQEIERAETEMHIPEIGAKADLVIRNEKDLEFLLTETDKIMQKIQ